MGFKKKSSPGPSPHVYVYAYAHIYIYDNFTIGSLQPMNIIGTRTTVGKKCGH